MDMRMIDLRTVETGVRLTQAERLAAQMRHLAAMNDAQLAEKKARNARRGLIPMACITCRNVSPGTSCIARLGVCGDPPSLSLP
jgi:hypothetical protein